MVLASAQLRARPERKDGGHPALCNAPPQWLRMRHQSHQSHATKSYCGAALHRWYLMAPASAQLRVLPERKDGSHPAFV